MKIKRTTANKIMSLATRLTDHCLLGIMNSNEMEDEKIIHADSHDELTQLILDHPRAILIYNQHPQAIEIKDEIVTTDGQQHIEVFQDTEGVFGLRAYHQIGKIQTPVALELAD